MSEKYRYISYVNNNSYFKIYQILAGINSMILSCLNFKIKILRQCSILNINFNYSFTFNLLEALF